jgi:hypothetical protein
MSISSFSTCLYEVRLLRYGPAQVCASFEECAPVLKSARIWPVQPGFNSTGTILNKSRPAVFSSPLNNYRRKGSHLYARRTSLRIRGRTAVKTCTPNSKKTQLADVYFINRCAQESACIYENAQKF